MRTLVFGRALAIAVLVATMLAWAPAAAQADPLTLELSSSRELCTANTLTELSWTIAGGRPPYTLSIDGETVDANAESHRANCGPLMMDPLTEESLPNQTKTFSATVADSEAAPATTTGAVNVELAPPLPAPTNLWLSGLTQEVIYGFDYSVAGAGAQAPEDAGPYERLWQTGYVLRVRATSASAAEPYDIVRVPQFTHVLEWTVPGPHHGMVASMRHPIERHTPSALIWSAPVSFALAETPQNVTVTATHDTVTVSWDEQPHADCNSLSIDGPGYHNDAHVWDLSTNSGRHTYTFERMPPETEFDIHISIGCYADEPEETSYYTPNAYAFTGARTKAAPSDWTPPPVGPLNLRATATHDEITLTWDRPHPDARPAWRVLVYEGERYFATLAGHSERPVRIRFGMRSYVRPSTTYRVLVTHHGATTGSGEVTVTTAAAPAEGVAPTSYERLIPPVGTTYTFTPSIDPAAADLITFDLHAARPWPFQRPGLKPELGDVIVRTTFAIPSPPLTLELASSRDLCTANTLTELSWTIAGGRPPYTLTIDGETVDANAESHRANCGPNPADPMGPVPGTTPAKTFRASVTDSQATPVTATADVQLELVEALPAPTGIEIASLSVVIGVTWTPKPAPAEGVSSQARFLPQGLFLVRHRLLDADSWTYELRADLRFPWWIVLLDEGTSELMFAELRDPLEAETPEALEWSAATRAATHAPPENLTAAATHNTVTVTWQRQPDALETWVFVRLLAQDPYDGSLADFVQETGVTGDASVTFEHLPPDAEFVARVEYGDDVSASVSVRTTAAPDGYDYAAIPQGAQNLRATLSDTGTRITVTWDDPYPGNENHYDAHLIDVETGRRLDRADIVLAGTNSWSTTGSAAFGRVQLGREYRVNVGHDAIPFTEASILVTTPEPPPSPPAARRAAAQADPLTLELTSSRALCTANTLTELSWTIAGGRPPYTLTIDGETVDSEANSHRANCGPLPTDPFTNDPLPNPTKSFSATVTDSQTTPDSATDDVRVELVPPLPAPQNVQYASYVADVPVRWDPVPGAGAQSPRSIHPDSGTDWQITGVVRTRLLDDRVWSYDVAGFAQGRKTLAPLAGLRVLSVAAVRHPLEVDTPEALNWSAELTYAATTEAQNVVLTVTHDTLTASWDKQPYARDQGIHAILELEATGGERRLQLWEEEGVSGRHEVTIGDLPPETDFTFAIVMVDTSATSGNPFRRAVRTKPAPPGWIPLPTGAQNLRVTSSDDGHTISWDPPSPHSARSWALRVDNVATGRNVFHTFTSGATTWTISRDRLFSSARYRVTVVHFDLNRIETSIEFNTTQSPRIGQRGARSTGGGIEQQMFAFFSVWPRGWWRSALITTDSTTWPHWVSALLSPQTGPRENH